MVSVTGGRPLCCLFAAQKAVPGPGGVGGCAFVAGGIEG